LEIVVPVERRRPSIYRVDNDHLAAGDPGGFDDPAKRSHQKFSTETRP
jgi:hypothetical protein